MRPFLCDLPLLHLAKSDTERRSKVAVDVIVQHVDGARVGRWRLEGWRHHELWAEQHQLDGADHILLLWRAHVLGDERHPILRATVDREVLARPEVLDEAELVRHALVYSSEAQQQLAEEVDVCRIVVIDGNKARRSRAEPKACCRYGPVQ